jgi:hypothetical protein
MARSRRGRQEVVVELGLDLLAELLEVDAKWAVWPARSARRSPREGDVEVGRRRRRAADEVGLEARDQPLLAEDQRHPVGRPALERLAVARPDERDDRVVAVLRAAVLDRAEGRVLVAQLLDDWSTRASSIVVDVGLEVEVPVVAERDLGADGDGRLEDERLALSAWTTSTSAFAAEDAPPATSASR